jgi:ABC-2 type transport system ATP-binding protein
MGTGMIETVGLGKTFQGRRGRVDAVHGVDLAVRAGEIFGLIGPNGAGKTTTLRMLATLLAPSSGRASVAGADLFREPHEVRRRIGYVGQSGGTDPLMTARKELVIQGRVYGMNKADAMARAAASIGVFELGDFADRPSGTYSGGQRRRLDLALGLIHGPRLVLLDEPTTGLDPQSRAHLWDWVRWLRDEGTTVLLTTHYLDEADSLSDRVAIIDHGRIVAHGTPGELKRQIAGDVVLVGAVGGDPAVIRRLLVDQPYVREAEETTKPEVTRLYVQDGEESMAQILKLLDSNGFRLKSISLTRPSLDDVFLRQTGRSLRDAAG